MVVNNLFICCEEKTSKISNHKYTKIEGTGNGYVDRYIYENNFNMASQKKYPTWQHKRHENKHAHAHTRNNIECLLRACIKEDNTQVIDGVAYDA